MKTKKENPSMYVCLVFISFIFVLLNSSSISPFLSRICDGTDSAMFQVIGKGWLEGKLPYADLWDSKGPLIFFINMLGYAVTKSGTGIFVISIIAWFATSFFTCRMFSLRFERKSSVALTFVILFSFSLYLGRSGNNVSDYALPFITASLYLSYKFFADTSENKYEHNYKYAFVYGVTFAVCLMMRLSDAVGVCASVAVISLCILSKRLWKNFFQNVLMFLLGFLISVLPFAVYFISRGLGYDLIYGTLLYNLSYIELGRELDFGSIFDLLRIPVALFFDILLFAVGLYTVFKDKSSRWKGIFYISVSALTALYFLRTYMFIHYSAVSVPYGIIAVLEIKENAVNGKEKFRNFARACLYVTVIAIAATAVAGSATNLYNRHYKLSKIEIAEEIPESDLDSFVAYNADSRVYLELNCFPCYKYFAYQDWAECRTEETEKEIKDIYSSCKAKWILFKPDGECLIEDILAEYYEPFKTDGVYTLYKIKNSE